MCGVLRPAAEANPYQVEVLNRWWSGDNSIRHLLVHFQASVPANGQSNYTLRHGSTDIVDVVVKESVGVGASLYPVSAVIPLPRGVYFDTAGFSVVGVPDPGESVNVTEDGSSITVTTGPVRFTVNKTNFNLLDTVWFDGNGDRQYASAERVVLPDDGVTSFHGGIFDGCQVSGYSCVQSLQRDRSMPAPTCVVEENGPARAVVRCERLTNYVDADDNGIAETHEHGYAVRIYAYAGRADVKIDYQLQNAAKGGDLTQDKFADPLYFNSLDLRWNLELSAPTVRVGRHNDSAYSQSLGSGVYVAQESDDVYTIRNAGSGSTLESCSTTDVCQPYGWIDASDGSRGVFATIRNFWQMWPNGLEVDGSGQLVLQLWPSWSSMWRENQSPPRFSSSGVYWLEDMQAAYKEVLLHFHDGSMTDADCSNLAKTFQYYPVPTLDNTWYETTAVTLDYDGHHGLTSPSHATTRLYDWCANDAQACDRSEVDYRMGWDNFWMESPSRKESPDSGGGYPPTQEFFIASESPHHYWQTDAFAIGELNIRPQWLPGFDYDTEWSTLLLESNGDTLRDQGDTADYPLPDSGRDAKKWGDEHVWMYHVEDAYYVTGNPWIRDQYEFIGEFRRRRLKSHPGPGGIHDGYSNPATRAAAHTLHNALEAYRITGDTEILALIDDYMQYRLFPEHDPRCGNRRIDVGWDIECNSAGETAAPWEGGFLMRTLIDIMSEVDRDSSTWATAFQMASAWATYNEQYGRFANRLDCVTPAPCGVTASQSEGNSHTVPDPVMWYYWNTGRVFYRNDVEDYVDGGINGGSPPYYSANWTDDWNGDFHNRYRDWVLAQSRPDATPPAAVADLAVTLGGSTATVTWSAPAGAAHYQLVWSDKPIAASYTSDPGFTNWWRANPVDPGQANPAGTAVTVSSSPVYFVLFSFDAAGNMSGMSNVASDGGSGAVCGNGVVEVGEDCDPGPSNPNDCCSSTCSYEAAGYDCSGLDVCTLDNTCDGSGTCSAGIPGGCGGVDVPANTWVQRNPTGTTFPPGFLGSYSLRSWTRFVYNSVDHKIVFYEGYTDPGGDPRGSSIYASALYDYDLESRVRRALKISNWDAGEPDYPIEPDNTLDPTPANRHTYKAFAYVPDTNSIYMVTGANGRSTSLPDGIDLNTLWEYDLGQGVDGSWTAHTAHPGGCCPNSNGVHILEGHLNYVPGTNRLWLMANNTVYTIDLNTKQWSQVTPSGDTRRGWESSSTVDTNRAWIVIYGGDCSAAPCNDEDNDSNKLTRYDTSTHVFADIGTSDGPTKSGRIVYDPDHDVYIVVTVDNPPQTWVYNPSNDVWLQLDPEADPPTVSTDDDNDTQGYIAYDDLNDVVIWATPGNYYVFRYQPAFGSDETPPTVPSELTANALSESSIALNWNASSDPESGISRYKIYRDGVYAGQSTTLSWVDTGLAEATSYGYRVSAVNGAGLESGLTAEVAVSTQADTQAPSLVSATAAGDPTRVTVVFDEPVEQASATDTANYSINNGITISGATLGTDQATVTLQTSTHIEGVLYTLTVSGVRDRAASPNTIAPGSQAGYSFSPQLVVSNVVATSGASYEVAEGLAIGSMAYSDRTFTYTQVPFELAGATYIRTANDDKLSQATSFLSFDVNQAVIVYVAHDDRYAVKPAWLQSFTDTGLDLQINVTFSVYAKDFPPGTIQLGGNVNPVEVEDNNMYTVILAPQQLPTVPPPPPTELRAE